MSRVVMKSIRKYPYPDAPWGCQHVIRQEVLTDDGKRIPFPVGAKDWNGNQLFAQVESSTIHFYNSRHVNETCEEAHMGMIVKHLKALAKVMEWVKRPIPPTPMFSEVGHE